MGGFFTRNDAQHSCVAGAVSIARFVHRTNDRRQYCIYTIICFL